MKILFIVYHDLQTEARSQEILECSNLIGESTLISYSKPHKNDYNYKLTSKGRKKYFSFILDSIKYIRKEKPEVIILHDNYTAILIKYIRLFYKNIHIVYDSSELYIEKKKIKSIKDFNARFLVWAENKYIKHSDTVIAANIERAEIMKSHYNLKETPLVFDNIHKINDNIDKTTLRHKYIDYLNDDEFLIVYGGGIERKRMTYELAQAVHNLGNQFRLIVVGMATKKEIEKFSLFLKNNNINNVAYLGFLPRNEWRFLLQEAKISVSVFTQDSQNNINCASGKVYESIFENTPVLTSTNPPLKRLCKEEGIGVSTEDFYQGIMELKSNYDFYKLNTVKYIEKINYDNRVVELAKKIKERIVV